MSRLNISRLFNQILDYFEVDQVVEKIICKRYFYIPYSGFYPIMKGRFIIFHLVNIPFMTLMHIFFMSTYLKSVFLMCRTDFILFIAELLYFLLSVAFFCNFIITLSERKKINVFFKRSITKFNYKEGNIDKILQIQNDFRKIPKKIMIVYITTLYALANVILVRPFTGDKLNANFEIRNPNFGANLLLPQWFPFAVNNSWGFNFAMSLQCVYILHSTSFFLSLLDVWSHFFYEYKYQWDQLSYHIETLSDRALLMFCHKYNFKLDKVSLDLYADRRFMDCYNISL